MDTKSLIAELGTQLQPVQPLRPPMLRALIWLVVVAAASAVALLGLVYLGGMNPQVFASRMAQPRIAIECVAIALTGISAVIAAFVLSVPGRSALWGWLPAPFAALWIGASGAGCWQNGWTLPGQHGLGHSSHCFAFIVAVSVPLAAALFWVLRRARPINPLPVTLLGGLGVAATSAFLLEFFHPFDVTVIDLGTHLAAMALVILVASSWRRRLAA